MKIFPQTVKNKILTIMTIIMLFLVMIPAFLYYRNFMHSLIDLEIKSGKGVYKQVLKTLEERSQVMGMLAIAVSNMPRVQEYLYLEDRGSLAEIMLPLYDRLKQDYEINVFHFHEKPAVSFLRLQNLKKYGDDLSSFRHSVVEANKTQKMVIALERGVAGLSNRAIMPIFYENEHIGSMEFGMPVNDAMLLTIKEQIGCDISIVIPDGDRFIYQAKTHSLTIPEKMYPFLTQMMTSKETVTKQISKNGKQLITTYGPIKNFSGETIAVLAVPIDITKIIGDARKSILTIIGTGIGVLLFSLLLTQLFFRVMINRPINELKEKLGVASQGDLTQTFKISSRNGENGKGGMNEFMELGEYFNRLIDSVRNIVRDIDGNSNELNDSAGGLTDISQELSEGVGKMVRRFDNTAAATGEMSRNMDSIAAATDEAATSIRNMTKSTENINQTTGQIQGATSQAKEITDQAVHAAQDISGKMDELGTAAADIGQVTETISGISAQINLLALNATIEAARAGEAGRGFVVVAGEIKALAQQTATSTGEISTRIKGIQNSTDTAIKGIDTISSIITHIDEIVSDIISALDEQGETLTGLSRNITEAGLGMDEVASNIAHISSASNQIALDVNQVNTAAGEISKGSETVQKSAAELKRLSQNLRAAVNQFKI